MTITTQTDFIAALKEALKDPSVSALIVDLVKRAEAEAEDAYDEAWRRLEYEMLDSYGSDD